MKYDLESAALVVAACVGFSLMIGVFVWGLYQLDASTPRCTYPIDYELRTKQYNLCLDKLAEMRNSGGGSYTTNDDEDLDEAIAECGRQAKYISTRTVCEDK